MTVLHMTICITVMPHRLSWNMPPFDKTSVETLVPSVRPGQTLSIQGVQRRLDRLRDAAESGVPASTLHVPALSGSDDATVAALARHHDGPAWIDALERSSNQLLRSSTGLVAFRVGDAGLAVLPPFPMDGIGLEPGIRGEPLTALLTSSLTVGVALVRLGRYAIAVYEGQKLVVSKTDTRYVKSKHHAGGTSQQRFRRVRENQIHRLYVEAAGVLERQWRPWLDRLDYVALGGEAATVNGFVKECDFLGRLSPITLQRRLDVREPNRASLDQVGGMLYQCRVYPLQWDG